MTLRNKIIRFVRKNPTLPYTEIAKKLNCSVSSVKYHGREFKIPCKRGAKIGAIHKNGLTHLIFEFLNEAGDQTSVRDIIDYVNLHGRTVSYEHTVLVRLKWRNRNNIIRDCRTYKGQPDRNMYANMSKKELILAILRLTNR